VQTTLVIQPNGEVISLKAWRERFWKRSREEEEVLDDDNAAAAALWSDLGRSEDIIILLVTTVDG
jgi:hypothetical protein